MGACTVTPPPTRRKGLLGKLKNIIDYLDDKPNAFDPCNPCRDNGCPQNCCAPCGRTCGPKCSSYAPCCSTAVPCYKRGLCCGPANWSPYCPPTIVMPCGRC